MVASRVAIGAPRVGVNAPLGVAGLVAWFAADRLVYKDAGTTLATDGETVQQWTDLSPNGNHATQTTAANKPTLVANVVNSKPVIRFDGSNDNLTFTELFDTAGATATFFIVAKERSSVNGNLLSTRPSSANAGWTIRYNDSTHIAAFFAGAAGASGTTNCVCPDAFNVFVVTFNGATTGTIYVHRVAGTSWTLGTKTASSLNLTYINAPVTTSIGEDPSPSDIAEIVIYDTVLSAANRNGITNYLQSKYAIGI